MQGIKVTTAIGTIPQNILPHLTVEAGRLDTETNDMDLGNRRCNGGSMMTVGVMAKISDEKGIFDWLRGHGYIGHTWIALSQIMKSLLTKFTFALAQFTNLFYHSVNCDFFFKTECLKPTSSLRSKTSCL